MIGVMAALALLQAAAPQQNGGGARRAAVVDTMHGTLVPDPYRWLEDMGSAETVAWARAQDRAALHLVGTVPERAALRKLVADGAHAQRYGTPIDRNGTYFMRSFTGNGGGAYVRRRGLAGQDEVVLDAGTLAPAMLAAAWPDLAGERVAYAAARNGSQWASVRVRDVRTKRDLPDVVNGINTGSSGLSWAADGSGFYYERFDPPAGDTRRAGLVNARILFHRLGDADSMDRVVFSAPRRERWTLAHTLSQDGRFLVVLSGADEEPGNRVLVQDLTRPAAGFTTLVAEATHAFRFAGTLGSRIYLDTDDGAARGRVIAIDADRPARAQWREIVPEAADAISVWGGTSSVLIGNALLVMYRRDAATVVKLFDAEGRNAREIAIPDGGSVWSPFTPAAGGQRALYVASGVADPGTTYELDLATGASRALPRASLGYDPRAFVTEQVFYPARDGARIPMFLVHGRDTPRDGSAPVWMYGYGFARWSAAPWFQPLMVAWLARGGVFALPNTRGGGEYGEEWHRAGVGRHRQVAIDDYIAAAEWLIAQRWTAADRLVANGSSAGGQVAGAALLQRPDLFAAGVLDYPALDMLRYDLFTTASSWVPMVGSARDPDDFRALIAYSPYHNVRPGCYPPIFVAPGERDEIAPPFHAYKFVAALQHAQQCAHPVVLRMAWGAGHSAGASTEDQIDMWADQLAFLRLVLPR